MKKSFCFWALVALAVVDFGCGRQYMISRPDMHLAPSLERLPEKFTVVNYAVNPVLDI